MEERRLNEAVDHELYGKRRQNDTEHARYDVDAGRAEPMQIARRSPHAEPRDRERRRIREGDERVAQRMRARDIHEQEHGCQRAGSGDHRDREREDGRILLTLRGLLLFARRSRAGLPCEEHVDRDQQEQDAAGDTERGQRDPEIIEQIRSDQSHAEHHRACDDDSLIDDAIAFARLEMRGRRRRDRDHPDRVDDRDRRRERGRAEVPVHEPAVTSRSGRPLRLTRRPRYV